VCISTCPSADAITPAETTQPTASSPSRRRWAPVAAHPSRSAGRGSAAFQDRLEDVLVLLDRFGGAAVEPVGEPVPGGLPDGVVGVAGLGGDALVELVVQVAEFVDDGGFGGAADFAAGACAVAGVAEGDLAAP